MKHLKTYENFSVNEATGDFFRSWKSIVDRIYKGLQSNDEKSINELKDKYSEYIELIPVKVANSYIPNVIEYFDNSGDIKNIKEDEIAKIFMGAKQVSKDDKGNWIETGARGSSEGPLGKTLN